MWVAALKKIPNMIRDKQKSTLFWRQRDRQTDRLCSDHGFHINLFEDLGADRPQPCPRSYPSTHPPLCVCECSHPTFQLFSNDLYKTCPLAGWVELGRVCVCVCVFPLAGRLDWDSSSSTPWGLDVKRRVIFYAYSSSLSQRRIPDV